MDFKAKESNFQSERLTEGSLPVFGSSLAILGFVFSFIITMAIPKISRRRPRSVDDPTAGVDPGFLLFFFIFEGG